jgi:CDP-diacylglycerol---serine O-phosphatidyltransferase
MKKHIPNIITSLNLISGCISIVMALKGHIEVAALLIILSALFDFGDGLSARLLHVKSKIGVDLDSLADLISFGVAPAMILFSWLELSFCNLQPILQVSWIENLKYIVFIVPALSAVRLAKFNHDERQSENFIGLATPANALFLGFIQFAADKIPVFDNYWVIIVTSVVFSLLLVSNLPMFSLKFKNFNFKKNVERYIFIGISAILLLIFQLGAFPVIILTYILISLVFVMITKLHWI